MASMDSHMVMIRNSIPSAVDRRRIEAFTKPEMAEINGNVSVCK